VKKKNRNRIRPVALCIFCHESKILTAKSIDRVKHEIFYRPVGGGIDFGENSAETVIREVKEELGLQIMNPWYLGTLENIFTSHGRAGHELVQIYCADLPDESWYAQDSITTMESPLKAHHMEWRPLEFFIKGEAPLYPTGLLELLLKTGCANPQRE
jgi:8-oxo-dGTP pyrophosphatase MutT (NUDIX family)